MFADWKKIGLLTFLPVALAIVLMPSTAFSDDLVYAFRGVLPAGASSHPSVSDGETFTAYFTIATEAMDSDPDPTLGVYNEAVLSGTLTFSGGYVAPLDFSNFDVFVFNDSGVGPVDGVSVRDGFDIVFQASNRDLSILSSDSLPLAGTQFASGPDPDTLNFFQLTYEDPAGSIEYRATSANNVVFRAKDAVAWQNVTGTPDPWYDVSGNWLAGNDAGPPSTVDTAWFGLTGFYDVWWDSITFDRTASELCITDGDVTVDNRDGGTYTWNITGNAMIEGPARLRLGDISDTVNLAVGSFLIVDGLLSAQTGTTVSAELADVGRDDFGRISIFGAGTELNIGGGGLFVGVNDGGDFFVTGGAVANDGGNPRIGASSNGNGLVEVIDAGSQWNVGGNIEVGNSPGSVGSLNVLDGGSVSAGGDIEAGVNGTIPQVNFIEVQNALLSSDNSILLGGSANAVMTVSNNGEVSADNQIQISTRGTIVTQGTGIPVLNAGLINNVGQLNLEADTGSDVDAILVNGGTIHSQNTSVNFFLGSVVHDGVEIRTDFGSVNSFFGNVGGSGDYTGTGSIAFEDDFYPGAGSGIGTIDEVAFEGDVFMTNADSVLHIDIASAAPENYDRLVIAGDLTLSAANLNVQPVSGSIVNNGDVFQIVTLDGIRNGIFSGLAEGAVAASFGGIDLIITYNGGDGNDIELVASGGILLGDVNGDGEVNLLDVQPFIDLLATGGFVPEADINGDGVVDLLDVDPFVALLSGP